MKQEEMSDMCTILVEGQDGRAEVMDQVRKQHKPVVIVVPEHASQIFERPEDFHDLKRVKRECGIPITLVLPGHERMRNWARRQGFTVYASSETCAKALARRDRLNALRGIASPNFESQNVGRLTFPLLSEQDDDEEDDALWSWETEEPPDEEDLPGASSSRSAAPENDKSDKWDAMNDDPYMEQFGTPWRITGNGWEMAWPAGERTTDGIVPLARQEQMPLDLTQFVPVIKTGAVDRGEGTPIIQRQGDHEGRSYNDTAWDRSSIVGAHPRGRLGTGGRSGVQEIITEPLYESWSDQREKVVPRGSKRGHTLVLVLTVLLILGLLGGIGFGYVLSLLHAGLGALPWMEHLLFS